VTGLTDGHAVQVWFAGELNSAILIIVGLGVCSPLLALLSVTGSLIASLTVIAMGAPYSLVYRCVASCCC
jgi:urea transporter